MHLFERYCQSLISKRNFCLESNKRTSGDPGSDEPEELEHDCFDEGLNSTPISGEVEGDSRYPKSMVSKYA